MMEALQEQSACRITLEIERARMGLGTGLRATAKAHPWVTTKQDRRQSVLLRFGIPASSAMTGVAAIFRGLLALDFEMSKEWAEKQK